MMEFQEEEYHHISKANNWYINPEDPSPGDYENVGTELQSWLVSKLTILCKSTPNDWTCAYISTYLLQFAQKQQRPIKVFN
jgi:hypothetical protein